MVATKVVGGVLALSLANLALGRFTGTEPAPDAVTRLALTDACHAALAEHAPGLSAAPRDAVRLKQLGDGHYWVTFTGHGARGARPVACDLVRDHGSWRAESVTVVEW